MSEFEDKMADLAAYLVSEFDMEPRDAAGVVMSSPLTQELYASNEPITEQKVKDLAENYWEKGSPKNTKGTFFVYSNK